MGEAGRLEVEGEHGVHLRAVRALSTLSFRLEEGLE
jgi:hypothetical protein